MHTRAGRNNLANASATGTRATRALALAAAFGVAALAHADDWAIVWSTLDNAGGSSGDGTWLLQGSIGQLDVAGLSQDAEYSLRGGYWVGPAAPLRPGADFNFDGFVDFLDYDAFIEAFERGDERADIDGDRFLDLWDFDEFIRLFEGG